MLNWKVPDKWWSRFLWIVATYVCAADFVPNLLLIIVNCSGYLPYSDRPGAGWQPPHLPSMEEIQFFWGFALLLLKPTSLYALIFAAAAWILGFCALPS